MALTPLATIDWVTDSGASNHTTSDASNLTIVRPHNSTSPSSIIVGNRIALPVTLVGDTTLPDPFYLNIMLVAPNIIQNLLSVRRFTTIAGTPMALVASASNWHHYLGHPGVNILSKLSKNSCVLCSRRTHDFYHTCQLDQDLWTSPIVSVSGYKYYMVILDDCSHFMWTFPL
jgi:hypothetical protein